MRKDTISYQNIYKIESKKSYPTQRREIRKDISLKRDKSFYFNDNTMSNEIKTFVSLRLMSMSVRKNQNSALPGVRGMESRHGYWSCR